MTPEQQSQQDAISRELFRMVDSLDAPPSPGITYLMAWPDGIFCYLDDWLGGDVDLPPRLGPQFQLLNVESPAAIELYNSEDSERLLTLAERLDLFGEP